MINRHDIWSIVCAIACFYGILDFIKIGQAVLELLENIRIERQTIIVNLVKLGFAG